MPKQRITKEMVVDAAFEIARKDGIEKATVKTIAEKLGCSVQPIYSYCKNMDGLKNDVAEKARTFILAEVGKTVDRNDLFRSTGHAYIQIAKNEPHIFRMYLFQERKNVSSLDDIYCSETNPNVSKIIAENLNISISAAKHKIAPPSSFTGIVYKKATSHPTRNVISHAWKNFVAYPLWGHFSQNQ